MAIRSQYDDKVGCTVLKKLQKRKLGFTFDETFNEQPQIVQSIVLDALLEANESLLATDTIRIPAWISEEHFKQFISKISL